MSTLTLVLDPTTDSYDDVRDLIDRVFGIDASSAPETEDTTVPNGWTPARMRRYVQALGPNQRKALRYMADHAPTIPVPDVASHLGAEGAVYAGMMSGFGHAVRRAKGVKVVPFVRHYDEYEVPESVAALADKALTEVGA